MTSAGVKSIGPDPAKPMHQPPAGSSGPAEMTPLRELQLVNAWRDGDGEALATLLDGYQYRVFGICQRMVKNREDARDLTQESLTNIMQGLRDYDARAKLSTWVYRVTVNTCLNHLRREKIRRHASLDEPAPDGMGITLAQSLPQRELSAEQSIQQRELHELLQRALETLEPDVRALLVLRDLQQLDYESISEVLDVPVGTVKSRLFRARAALRAAVEAEQNRRERAETRQRKGEHEDER